jgi:hypothetical protein
LAKKIAVLKIDDDAFKRDVDKLLNTFKKSVKKKILRQASTPLVSRMRKTTKFDDYTGEARRSIRSMTWAKSDSYFVGPKRGVFQTIRPRTKKHSNYDPFYMKFIEYGWNLKLPDGSTKYIAPTYFIRNAVDESKSVVLQKIRDGVQKELKF